MKSNTKKRLIAFMLCMVLVLSSATSAFADDNVDGFNDKTGCQAMTLTQEMKNADDQTIGTVYADIPENAFYLDDPSDEITMDLAKVENEESILDAIQSNLKEHEALTDAVMCKVDFKVNGVSAEPNTAIALRFENLNMNLENATAFSHDTSLKIIDKTVVSAGEEQALQISADKNQIYGFYTVETVVEEENVTKSETVTFNNDDIATVATGGSTYTIAATKQLQVHVTYRVSDTNTKLFAGKTYTLKQGGTLNLAAQKSDNYTVASVYRADENGNKTGNALSLRQDGKIAESLSENTNYCVFYQATTDNDFRGNVTFYDYQINPPAGQKSINDPSYYGKADNNRRFAMGNSGYRKSGEKYSVYKNYIDGQDDVDINEYNEKRQFYIYKDIITGVNVSTGALVMGTNKDGNQIVEPGLFTTENAREGSGKQYYTDFNLKFNRTGNEYRLSAVERSGQTVVSDMSYFFPLDAYKGKEKDGGEAFSDTNHNYYFGMRYDIQFKLKDYIGALTYSFTGDDDLWVVMDGNRVVVDVGGIHDKMDGNVDLWTVFLGKEKYTDAEKEAYVAEHGSDHHQLTVLYLERGAYKSNCNMTYVLPNSSIVNPGEIQNTSLTFTKTDAETGKGLEGAEFGVYEDEALTTSLGTIRSDENGTVTLSNLSYGEVYYLKETKAPSGYVAGNTVYKVVVESQGGTTTAKMFAVGDKDETAVTAVPNAKANWEQSKTAQLVDWNARTYDITLSASSLVKTAETTERPVDVSLVIDTSGSMRWDASYELIGEKKLSELDTSKTYYYCSDNSWYEMKYGRSGWYSRYAGYNGNEMDWSYKGDKNSSSKYTVYSKKDNEKSRIQAVKDAATAFVSNLRTTSPNSRVSVTGFSSSVNTNTSLLRVGVDSEYNQIISAINGLGSTGGTRQDLGLNAAKDKLNASTTADKYVVLLTDGTSDAPNSAVNSATAVKDAGIKLMTIGVSLTDETQTWLAGLSSGQGYSFNASSTQEINQAFAFVSQTIEDTLPISGAVVRDYIDPRFELVTPEADIAAMGGEIKTDENGQTYIEWNNAVIGKKGTDGTPGWCKIIRVKAKDAYIGGNDVVTNGPESGITVGIDDRKFNQPTVNVKVDFNVNNGEKTIFKGDKPGDYIDDAKLNEVTKLKSTTDTEYTMLGDVNVTTQWYKDEKCTTEISKNDILNTPLTEETVYYAKVTVTPIKDGTASAANSIGDKNGNCTQDGKKYYAVDSNGVTKKDGTYTIKLVSGAINITKKLENATNTDKEFNFTITRTDVTPNQEIATVKVTVAASQTTGTLAGDELKKVSNLARGTYVVTENATSGYDVKGILKGVNTNCRIASTTDDSITFVMGSDMDGKDVIGMDKVGNITESTYNKPAGILGVVEYTNEEVTNGWGIKKVSASSDNPYIYLEGAKFKLTSTTNSSVAYYGKSNQDGLLIWYNTEECADTNQVTTLPKGTYTMEEKTAPAGYVRSAETWEVKIMKNGTLKSITSSVNGTSIKTVSGVVNGKDVVYYLYQNEALYALPHSGDTGIYLYMIGGMLLMFAAVWILYKNKCKEVLGK